MKDESATKFELPSSSGDIRPEPTLEVERVRVDPEEFRRFLDHAAGLECDGEDDEPLSLRSWLHIAETWRITQALRRCRGNRSAAARALGIGRRTLYAKMEKLGITASWGI